MNYCSKCGKALESNVSFCSSCGTNLEKGTIGTPSGATGIITRIKAISSWTIPGLIMYTIAVIWVLFLMFLESNRKWYEPEPDAGSLIPCLVLFIIGGIIVAVTMYRRCDENDESGKKIFWMIFGISTLLSVMGFAIISFVLMIFGLITSLPEHSVQSAWESRYLVEVKCSYCKKDYDDTMKSCPHCGHRTDEKKSARSETWYCSACNEKNANNSRHCKNCGKYK